MKTVSLWLPDNLIERLDSYAASELRSRNNVATIALEWFLSAAECKRLHELEPAAIHSGAAAERPGEAL
jgi:predicted transcriptional regulator